MDFQRKEVGVFLPNLEACGSWMRSKMTILYRASPEAWRAFETLTDLICRAPNPETKFEKIFDAMALKLSFKLKRIFPTIKKVKGEETDNDSEEDPKDRLENCLLYTSPSPRDGLLSRMPSSA